MDIQIEDEVIYFIIAKKIIDEEAEICNVNADDHWKIYGQEEVQKVTDIIKTYKMLKGNFNES